MTIKNNNLLLMGAVIAAITTAAQADETVFDVTQNIFATYDRIAISHDHALALEFSPPQGCVFSPPTMICASETSQIKALTRMGDAWRETQTIGTVVETNYDSFSRRPAELVMNDHWALAYTQHDAHIYYFSDQKQQWAKQPVISIENTHKISSAAVDRTGAVWIIDDSNSGAVQIFRRNKAGKWVPCQRLTLAGRDRDYKFVGPIKFDGNTAFVRGESRTQSIDVVGPSASAGPLVEKQAALWTFKADNNRWRATQRISYPIGAGTKSTIWDFDAAEGALVVTGFRDVDSLIGAYGNKGGSFGVQRFVRKQHSDKFAFDSAIANYVYSYDPALDPFNPSYTQHLYANVLSNDLVLTHGEYSSPIFPFRKSQTGKWQQLTPPSDGYADTGYYIIGGDQIAASQGTAMISRLPYALNLTMLGEFQIRPIDNFVKYQGTIEQADYLTPFCKAGQTGHLYHFSIAIPGSNAVMGLKAVSQLGAGTEEYVDAAAPPRAPWDWNNGQLHLGYVPATNGQWISGLFGVLSRFDSLRLCANAGVTPHVDLKFYGKPSTAL